MCFVEQVGSKIGRRSLLLFACHDFNKYMLTKFVTECAVLLLNDISGTHKKVMQVVHVIEPKRCTNNYSLVFSHSRLLTRLSSKS